MSDTAASNQPLFEVVRIYAKDTSLETPNTPKVFQQQWKPELKVEFDTKTTSIGVDQYEVVLRITVTCKTEGTTAFICEVNQAGIFFAKNFDKATLDFALGASAPSMLYPYAREYVSNLVSRATFPQLTLAPLNFEAVYRAKQEQAAQAAAKANQENPANA